MYEIQPDIKWNKGSAVVWLLEMLGLITDVVSQVMMMLGYYLTSVLLFCLKALAYMDRMEFSCCESCYLTIFYYDMTCSFIGRWR